MSTNPRQQSTSVGSSRMVPAFTRYAGMWQICPASDSQGFRRRPIRQAQTFLEQVFLANHEVMKSSETKSLASESLQSHLLDLFDHNNLDQNNTDQLFQTARAGLCLRCYISEPILKACQKIDHLFKGQGCFTYRDLLPFVLNDDAQAHIVLDLEKKQHLLLNQEGQTQPAPYEIFAVKVLQSYQTNSLTPMSLDNWAYLQTKQNPEIKKFLSEFGFQQLSDWALLNRIKKIQLERLSAQDQDLVASFHRIYRNDRRQQSRQKTKCPVPNKAQLQRMLDDLPHREFHFQTTETLLAELKRVAAEVRNYDLWGSRESLETYDFGSKVFNPRHDLPASKESTPNFEQDDLLTFFHQTLHTAMAQAIAQCLSTQLNNLSKSKHYRDYAESFVPGLLLYYQQGLALREVAAQLQMSSWDQARRILNPGKFLRQVRTLTIEVFLEHTLTKSQELGFIQQSPSPDYLSHLIEQVETFIDAEIFTKAAEEIRAGKNRNLNSPYAQQLILKLESISATSAPGSSPIPTH